MDQVLQSVGLDETGVLGQDSGTNTGSRVVCGDGPGLIDGSFGPFLDQGGSDTGSE